MERSKIVTSEELWKRVFKSLNIPDNWKVVNFNLSLGVGRVPTISVEYFIDEPNVDVDELQRHISQFDIILRTPQDDVEI